MLLSLYVPTTLTLNLHLATFPEKSVADTNTVVVPTLNLTLAELKTPAGTDSTRARYPELSARYNMYNLSHLT